MDKATFGAGCFGDVESCCREVLGMIAAASGYASDAVAEAGE